MFASPYGTHWPVSTSAPCIARARGSRARSRAGSCRRPASPDSSTSWARRRVRRHRQRRARARRPSASRPRSGACSRTRRRPGRRRAPRARGTPRPVPRGRAGPAGRAPRSESTRGWRRRWPGRRPPRPGPASFSSRCAVFTTSPITVGSPPARIAPTSTSPVFTPTRICTRDAEVGRERGEGRRACAAPRGPPVRRRPRGRPARRTGRRSRRRRSCRGGRRSRRCRRRARSKLCVDEAFDLLGVAGGRQRGEADEVGHQHGDQAALVGGDDQALPAFRAEPCAFGHRHAARRAGHPLTIPAGPA